MLIKEKLISFICQNFLVEKGDLDLDSSLIDQGIIDSFGLLEIAAFLKEEMNIEVEQEEMNNKYFGSIEKILLYVQSKTTK